YFSTDQSPANKRRIAYQANWNSFREWTNDPDSGGNPLANRISTPQHLEAGKKYFIEALHFEGGGGDHLSVAWRKPGDPPIQNGDAPLALELRPFDLDFDIPLPPATFVEKGMPVKLKVHVVAGQPGPITYQWQYKRAGASTFTE